MNTFRGCKTAQHNCCALKTLAGVAVLLLNLSSAIADSYSVLKDFSGGPGDGASPFASVTVGGSTMYGMTTYGGASPTGERGIVFRMNTDGSGFTPLHTFVAGANDGGNPYGSLTLAGSTLYGLTSAGGANDLGAAFKMNTDGTGFQLLHTFSGGAGDGSDPESTFTLAGSTLYGMSAMGGVSNNGVLFKMNTDGSSFTVLHDFASGPNDGRRPFGTLTLIGSTLYGMSARGGISNNSGVIFKLNTDGSNFELLHKFAGGSDDGRLPFGSLTLAGSKFYGMTVIGGDYNKGVVFQMNIDGSGYGLLHEFQGTDGGEPNGSITVVGSKLYGMTEQGGANSLGVLFEINTDDNSYSVLHEFAGWPDDGSQPDGDLSLAGSILYGMTATGGAPFGQGTIFAYEIPEPQTGLLVSICLILLRLRRARC